MTVVPNSTFLDSWSNNLATAQQFAAPADPTDTLANAQAVLGELFIGAYGACDTARKSVSVVGSGRSSPHWNMAIGLWRWNS